MQKQNILYSISLLYCVSVLYVHNDTEVCSDSDQTGSQYTCHLVCVSADV